MREEIERYETSLLAETGEGGCDGPCEGRGAASAVVDGDCPTPPDPAEFAKLEPIAKRKARLKAIEKCQEKGGADCICHGGQYEKVAERAFRLPLSGGGACIYTVVYRYKDGTCAEYV